MIIKALLIAAVLGFGLLVLRDRTPGQHQLARRAVMLLVVVAGVVAVLWPNLTTMVATSVGVGRGTDLVLYVLVITFVYYALATSQRIHHLERSITLLTRELAISRPTGELAPVPDDQTAGTPTLAEDVPA
jgi:hypothetical protein